MTVSSHYIQWNNHQSTLLNFFDDLLYSETFADITLVLDNNVIVKCHKIVLAACSTYFRTLFLNLPCGHQTIVLKNIKFAEMKSILEFMYHGKTNVVPDQLSDLLKIAETLQVKGLVIEDSNRSRTVSDPRGDAKAPTMTPLVINIGNNNSDVAALSLFSLHSSGDHHSTAHP